MRLLRAPAAWAAIALFLLLSGLAFVTTLNGFLDASTQALTAPQAEPLNVNQALIRPFLLQAGLAALLALPLVTARAYPEGNRGSGVARTWLDMLTVYGVMLVGPLLLVAALWFVGSPEWAPVASGYLGLLLVGAAFISAALLISSLAASPVAAGFATFALAVVLVAAAWLGRTGTPAAQAFFVHLSVGESLDDFAKGVIDTGQVVSCLTVAGVSLFLTHQALGRRAANRQLESDH
jgi:ABC-2 type transport system permease protein